MAFGFFFLVRSSLPRSDTLSTNITMKYVDAPKKHDIENVYREMSLIRLVSIQTFLQCLQEMQPEDFMATKERACLQERPLDHILNNRNS